MAGRLGSTGFVNTLVLAHPSNLTQAQIRAIKVRLTLNTVVGHLMVSPSHPRLSSGPLFLGTGRR